MFSDDSQQEITKLKEVNAELTRGLARCHKLVADCKAILSVHRKSLELTEDGELMRRDWLDS